MKNLTTPVLFALVLAFGSSTLANPVEKDKRLPPGRPGGWGLKRAPNPQPRLPKVLLIGDSVCNGYRDAVAARLKGKANVDAWVNPYHQNQPALYEDLTQVLKEGGPYAVIHFNIGLHGLSKDRIPEGQYDRLMRKYVKALKDRAGSARLIWASITPVTVKGNRQQLDKALNATVVEHNTLAAKIMGAEKIPIDDLYALSVARLNLAKGDGYHWSPDGYKAMADQVGKTISAALKPPADREPADAKEAAAKKTASSKEIDAAFAKWKASLPADQQKWESTLEACLGSFYLPLYKKDKVAGRKTAWDYVKDDPALPRVLIIGDSVSRGYTESVRRTLAGKANVHRAPTNCGPTASGLKSLNVWLGNGRWDVITFNFGIHDRATPPAVYEKRLAVIVARLQKTGAKLIWVSTTPLPAKSIYGSDQAIMERNQIAAGVMKKNQIVVLDLYALVHPRLAEYQNPNDCHFKPEGYNFLGKELARAVATALPKKPK